MTALGTALAGTYSNTSYVLANSATLSSSAFFTKSEVWITENVTITVPSGMRLDLDESHLFACGVKMWQGIVVQDGGRITAGSTRSTTTLIEDAIVAIDLDQITLTNASPNMPIDVQHVIFNRNHVGIKISNSAPTLTSLPVGISGCLFSSKIMPFVTYPLTLSWPNNTHLSIPGALRWPTTPTTGLAAPYGYINNNFAQSNLKLPYNNQPAHIGIKIENIGTGVHQAGNVTSTLTGVNFGHTGISDDYNLFDGIGNGIDVTDASLTIMNCVFQNMVRYSLAMGSWFGGNGIYHIQTDTTAMQLDLRNGGNSFYDCVTGVNVSGVKSCWITDVVFRSTHNVSTAPILPIQQIQGDVGVYYESGIIDFTVKQSQFNNVREGIMVRTPLTATNAIEFCGLSLEENYFGAEPTSATPYSSSSANTSEYMDRAIDIVTSNATGWNMNAGSSFIISNKIDRAFRGILVDGLEDSPMIVSTNTILIEDDATYPLVPQYGIAIQNNLGNMSVWTNTLDSRPWYLNSTSTVSLIYCNNNYGIGSPVISCNEETNGYYGFNFDGSNKETIWQQNTMCTNFAGLALTNNGIIGQQGTSSLANNNIWEYQTNCATNWNTGGAFYETYCENSDPTQSPLYVTGVAGWGTNPLYNGSFPLFSWTYDLTSPQSIFIAAGHLNDCSTTLIFNQPPSWRAANTSTIPSLADELNEDKINIYPNPTNGLLTITSAGKTDHLTISIFDLSGKAVFLQSNVSGVESVLDVSKLAPSIYMVELKSETGKIIRKKLVKTD